MTSYRYQIRCIAAPYTDEGEVVAEFDTLAKADAYWRRVISARPHGPTFNGISAAVLDHAIVVCRGETVWSLSEAPDDALRSAR